VFSAVKTTNISGHVWKISAVFFSNRSSHEFIENVIYCNNNVNQHMVVIIGQPLMIGLLFFILQRYNRLDIVRYYGAHIVGSAPEKSIETLDIVSIFM
jgi:hypothetical protein